MPEPASKKLALSNLLTGQFIVKSTILFFCLFGWVVLRTLHAQEVVEPQQAAPVINLLMGAKNSDAVAFKTAYSVKIRDDKQQGDWEKNLKKAQANLKKMYGEYASLSRLLGTRKKECYRFLTRVGTPSSWASSRKPMNGSCLIANWAMAQVSRHNVG